MALWARLAGMDGERSWGGEDRWEQRKGYEGVEPDDLLCSRNVRPQKALVGRAQ
jgi:hypothetical protein